MAKRGLRTLTPAEADRLAVLEMRIRSARARPPSRVRHTPRRLEPTDIYRLYGSDGELLYVGLSLSLPSRLAQHRLNRDLWMSVARIDVEHLRDRDAASRRERVLIELYKPPYNRNGGGA